MFFMNKEAQNGGGKARRRRLASAASMSCLAARAPGGDAGPRSSWRSSALAVLVAEQS